MLASVKRVCVFALLAFFAVSLGAQQPVPEIEEVMEQAEQGSAAAQFNLGVLYYNGQGVPQDYAEAVKWFRMSAENGHADAQFILGWLCDEDRGQSQQHILNTMHNARGLARVVQQDDAEALKWYHMAAKQGHALAQHGLGAMYYDEGRGVPQDYTEAAKWYRKSAEQGYANAQVILALLYKNGQGVSQDHAEALKWFRMAGEQGNVLAQDRLGWMYYGSVAHDYEEAADWYRMAAKQGEPRAQFSLGTMYEAGRGVQQDYAEAVRWYRMAAERGHAVAQGNLGVNYGLGEGVPQDYVKAHKWLNLAASGAGGQNTERYTESRNLVTRSMTPDQIAEAQRLAREWKPKTWEQLKAQDTDK